MAFDQMILANTSANPASVLHAFSYVCHSGNYYFKFPDDFLSVLCSSLLHTRSQRHRICCEDSTLRQLFHVTFGDRRATRMSCLSSHVSDS